MYIAERMQPAASHIHIVGSDKFHMGHAHNRNNKLVMIEGKICVRNTKKRISGLLTTLRIVAPRRITSKTHACSFVAFFV